MAAKADKEIKILKTEEDVAVALAEYTAERSKRFIEEKGSFTLVLSGGTLIDTMRKLTEPPYVDSLDWSKWLVFWLDERVVPWTDKDCNYKLAWDYFLCKVKIPSSNIYAINDKLSPFTPESAALDYEATLKKLVDNKTLPTSKTGGYPIFDVILLGMGPDGHVASLFPNRQQRYEKEKWVTFIKDSPKPPPERITLTFPVINSASDNAMVVTGADLAPMVKVALDEAYPSDVIPPPAREVSAAKELIWFLDADAASLLPPTSAPSHSA